MGAGALVAAVLAVVVLVAGWPLAGPVRSDPNSERVDVADDAGDVLDAAADALREAETFSYLGTVAAGGASTIWPAGLVGVGIEVDGRVALPVRVIERSRSLGLVVDTIVSGRGVWQRSAPPAGEVGDAPWGVVAEGPPALGLAQLPDLLDDAVEVQVSGSDRDGGRSLTAVVDQLDVGAPDGPVQARLDVVVDRAGVPERAVIDVPAAGGGTPAFRLDVEIDDLGVRGRHRSPRRARARHHPVGHALRDLGGGSHRTVAAHVVARRGGAHPRRARAMTGIRRARGCSSSTPTRSTGSTDESA